ncbi:hypothetical protein J3E64_001332 [Sphingobium sp. OAS761]|uniref:hypothetical protein n=1 Tax=Sphingobium sp. OAS761 TaxID=2817901 RepID=UPI0020A11CD2|nr:hypothetical protein [Sphingobium sp. OAS761]MCP1469650.1 hypothetical protein [Sphingobium sp. OAS761]
MKRIAAIAALSLISAPAVAQWEPPDEVLQVRIKGDGDWFVRCQYKNRKGEDVTDEARGPRDERLHIRTSQGSCTYQSAASETLTIRLKSPLYRCTLPEPGEGCEQTFPAGISGQFEIRRRN